MSTVSTTPNPQANPKEANLTTEQDTREQILTDLLFSPEIEQLEGQQFPMNPEAPLPHDVQR